MFTLVSTLFQLLYHGGLCNFPFCFVVSFVSHLLNSLPNGKILVQSKLKAFADNKINVSEKFQFVLGRVENIVVKGENAGYQHFLLFQQCFLQVSLSRSLKVGIVW